MLGDTGSTYSTGREIQVTKYHLESTELKEDRTVDNNFLCMRKN